MVSKGTKNNLLGEEHARSSHSLGRFIPFDIDWILLGAFLPIMGAGLLTMSSFVAENSFFWRQLSWVLIGLGVFFAASAIDWRFLKRTDILVSLFAFSVLALILLFVGDHAVRGSERWFQIGDFTFQPSDPVKLLVILILAKYFSRRHIEIAHIRHILVSGFYALVPFALVFLQPDLGTSIVIFLIWLGMIIVAGVSWKHLFFIFLSGALAFIFLWSFILEDYQKQRITTFLEPLADVRDTGYNAYQSTIAVGSGELLGRGVGYGTQSRLQFLPEYETDFIFAAFAEEWGFFGILIFFGLFGVLIWRILENASYGATNFEVLYGVGLAILFISHFTIHVGMNIGLLPVTGITLPFMSYGGSHLLTETLGLGMLMGMRKYRRSVYENALPRELTGV